jgi:hypothetical protein
MALVSAKASALFTDEGSLLLVRLLNALRSADCAASNWLYNALDDGEDGWVVVEARLAAETVTLAAAWACGLAATMAVGATDGECTATGDAANAERAELANMQRSSRRSILRARRDGLPLLGRRSDDARRDNVVRSVSSGERNAMMGISGWCEPFFVA